MSVNEGYPVLDNQTRCAECDEIGECDQMIRRNDERLIHAACTTPPNAGAPPTVTPDEEAQKHIAEADRVRRITAYLKDAPRDVVTLDLTELAQAAGASLAPASPPASCPSCGSTKRERRDAVRSVEEAMFYTCTDAWHDAASPPSETPSIEQMRDLMLRFRVTAVKMDVDTQAMNRYVAASEELFASIVKLHALASRRSAPTTEQK